MNLIEQIKEKVFASGSLDRLSSLIGADEGETRSAVEAAVPALLSALSGAASSGGAQKLVSALDNFDANAVNNLGSRMAEQPTALMEQGSGLLNSLLGNSTVSGIGNAISRFTGLGSAAVQKLLGFLMPLILGAIGGRFAGKAVSAQGLTDMFAEQKAAINNALPTGLSLSSVPGLAEVKTAAAAGAGAGGPGAQEAASSGLRWLVPVLGLAAIALVLWLALKPPATPDVTKLSNDLTGTFKSWSDALPEIKDAASADKALPKLKELGGKLEGMKAQVDKLPEAGKTKITELVKSSLGKLQEQATAACALPGVADKIKPVVEETMGKMAALAGIPAPTIGVAAPQITQINIDLSTTFKSLGEAMPGIKGMARPEVVLPKLKEARAKLEGMKANLDKLPEADRAKVKALIQTNLDELESQLTKLLWAPGGEKIKPAVDGILSDLAAVGGVKLSPVPQVSSELAGTFASLTQALGEIKDATTADKVLPKLKELSVKLDGAKAAMDKLSDEGKATISSTIKTAVVKLRELADQVRANGGAQVTPVMDAIMGKLKALGG